MKALHVVTAAAGILFFSCKKNSLPDETQGGKNTFGARVDGIAFLTSTTLFNTVRPVSVSYYTKPNMLYKAGDLFIAGIDARYGTGIPAGIIVINKVKIFSAGEYPLVDVMGYNSGYTADGISYYNEMSKRTYLAESGKLTITKLDTANNIVSGSFYFTGKDSLGAKVQITEGRFDARYDSF